MDLLLFHAAFMSAGLLMMLAAVLIAAALRKRPWWLKAHRPFGISGFSFMLAGLFIIIIGSDSQEGSLILGLHGLIGLTAVFIALLAPVMGFLIFKLKKKWLRPAHRLAGRIALLLAIINATLGLFMAGIF